MAKRDDLAAAVFITGAFEAAGLDPAEFNHTTPLSLELLDLIGEDLLEVEVLEQAALEGLSVREVLRGQAEIINTQVYHRISWGAMQRGSSDIKHLARAAVYATLCNRLGREPRPYVVRRRPRRNTNKKKVLKWRQQR